MNDAESKASLAGLGPAAGQEPAADPQATGSAAGARGPTDIQTYIGTRLREVYDDVANQPIPDRFLELMRQLDKS